MFPRRIGTDAGVPGVPAKENPHIMPTNVKVRAPFMKLTTSSLLLKEWKHYSFECFYCQYSIVLLDHIGIF